ncbi:MAG: mercury transporter [Oscillospiraceae bacterium]
METINDITNMFLLIIPITGALRIIYCIIAAAQSEDNSTYKKRALNALFFIVLAESILGIFRILNEYIYI